MAEFQTDYYNPMDREYEVGIASGVGRAKPSIEEPILTIGEMGQTVPDVDPTGKFKNMVQGVQASLRSGAKKIQLILMNPRFSGMGSGPRGYGEDVRQAMKDVFMANDAQMVSIEMPNTMTNLSGFNAQQGVFSETTRQKDMDEVKEAIRFASDIGQGGGVDVISWEFQRPISAVAKPEEGFVPEKEEVLQIVDEKTGRINAFRKNEVRIHLPYMPGDDKQRLRPDEKGMPRLEVWEWKHFIELAEKKNKQQQTTKYTPEKEFMNMQLNAQIDTAMGWAGHYAGIADRTQDKINEIQRASQEQLRRIGITSEQERQINIQKLKRDLEYEQQLAAGQAQQAEELKEKKERMKPVTEYAKVKSMDSYAQLGIAAMDESNNNPRVRHPIHVGPEIGFPHSYGGHPDEFIELVKGARDKMVHILTTPKIPDPYDPEGKRMIDNPNFKKGMSASQAKKEAHEHIQGMFDTGHMGMWLEHFKPHERYRKRLEDFNNWFMKQVDKLADADVVGGIQAVDSAGAAHGHLPAGQGIFPVVEAVQKLKQKGFKGYIVSEGHEEEKFGEGRILLKAWQAFNAPIESHYGPGLPARQFNDIHQGYFGRQRPPTQMFGGYTPPFGEYKPWSEIPFE